MSYQLFLDDVRTIDMVYPNVLKNSCSNDFLIARSYNEFVTTVKNMGLPYFISFDNDLGLDENNEVAPDGYACLKWLICQ